MKKNEKIMIGILVLILLVMIGVLVLNKTKINKQDIGTNVNNPNAGGEVNNAGENEIGRIVKVNGTLYYDTGEKSTAPRCGVMDGKITSNIAKDKIPEKDNEANFEGEYSYQGWIDDEIHVFINDEWCIFRAKGYSFCGVIKKVEENLFFVEPDIGEEVRKSADLIMVGKLQLDTNVKYQVGERVKITYDGYVMETYPAQVRAIKYEAIESDDFTIKVYDKSPEALSTVHKILDKSETDKCDYNIYGYKVNVNIVINGEETSLRNALLENKITMDKIIEKANKDFPNATVYRDGGSKAYQYDLYTIIKLNKIMDEQRIIKDVYIGMPDLNINDIEI